MADDLRAADFLVPKLPATLTDLYELTMAAGYWTLGRADEEAVFCLYFRRHPFGGGYTIAAGLARVLDYLEHFAFSGVELEHLATLRGDSGQALFAPAFLEYLATLRLRVDVDAVPEGTVVFPHEPLIRVRGPLLQAQLLETALLNLINFPTLAATQAARVVEAAAGAPVLEFGLRRAQGPDGALTASRAAYLGGVAATSNVLAGRLFGIPVRGTHAHSWVLSFGSEAEAFTAYGSVMPDNSIFLVDTYDTLTGVARAIEAGRTLEAAGHHFGGIRLDSGDLAYLSVEARRLLDEAGFPSAKIVASNDLDAETIVALRDQGARIDVYGVGTKLVTCYEQPALGGVYKLTAIADRNGLWSPGGEGYWRRPLKISADSGKTTVPGILGVRRYTDPTGLSRADMIYDELAGSINPTEVVDPSDVHHRQRLDPSWISRELLVPVLRGGQRAYDPPTLAVSRELVRSELASFHPGIRRALRPHLYPAGLELGLHEYREQLIAEALPGAAR
jgi:nicotinate phosphoribosyltransferase